MHKTEAVGTIARMWADNLPGKFCDSLAQMLIYEQSKLPKGKYIHYDKASVSWHELGRNNLAAAVLGNWILMLDTDHVFAPDLLERLVRLKKRYKAQVISGIYTYKFPPHGPVANMWTETPDGLKCLPITSWDPKAEVIPVGTVGAGCLLVDRSVFKRIALEQGKQPFDIMPGLSEDYSFCLKCKQLGIPVYLALKVECHHMVNSVLSVQDYQQAPDVLVPAVDRPVKTW